MKGIIFLDFDGVINNTTDIKDEENIDYGPMYISKRNLDPLIYLFKKCLKEDIKIVISSTWSVFGLKRIKHFFSSFIDMEILDNVILGSTNYLIYSNNNLGNHRSVEIVQYLINDKNLNEFNNYIFLDDSMGEFSSFDICRLIKVNPENGLTNDLVDKSVDILINEINFNHWTEFYNDKQIEEIMKLEPLVNKK